MYGSVFYNLWAGIIGFSIYFFSTLSDSIAPLNSLVGSFLAAATSFILMYAIRFLLGYVLYTPGEDLFTSFHEENERMREQLENSKSNATDSKVNTRAMEFNDQNSEEIAKVVKTMLLRDESVKN